jgi:hypothetical protein
MINVKREKIITIFLILSLTSNIVLATYCFFSKITLNKVQETVKQKQSDKKNVDFLSLFIEKVLKSETDVSFEDRLALETAVRETKDEEILSQWRKFTESNDPIEAQKEVKNLLGLLSQKISK